MGSGSWSATNYVSYNTSVRGVTTSTTGAAILDGLSYQDVFKNKKTDPMLNPKNVMRECRDSNEHPNTIPVIIACDLTGSMTHVGMEVASKIGVIVQDLFDRYDDVQICIMGIGDIYCDSDPIQIGQFESDIRIAEQLDKLYFERGGGGNGYESYTAAWYYGARHCDLDCWKRGKKGIIITTGDEPLNPYLNKNDLEKVSGDGLEADIETKPLYDEVSEKFDVYHIAIDSPGTSYRYYKNSIKNTFGVILPKGHLKIATLDSLAKDIVDCIDDALSNNSYIMQRNDGGISW